MINFHSLSSISEGKHQRTVRKVKEREGNIRRVFLPFLYQGNWQMAQGIEKCKAPFSLCAQTALTLRARARVHVISNGTIFLQPWLQMESVGQFRIAIELAIIIFFSLSSNLYGRNVYYYSKNILYLWNL